MDESSQYLFCPSENCFNVPEIFYLFNPLKNEVKYKCSCDSSNDKKLSLQEFLEKSVLTCYECRKIISDSNFLFCKNCKILIHSYCQLAHCDKNECDNFDDVNKFNVLNFCREHQSNFIFRCMNCDKSLCQKCDLFSHNEKYHSLKQILEFKINQNALAFVNYNLEKQKSILEIIKDISNNIIKNLENDIIMKQKILNNYVNNKANYSSILNIQNLFFKNNEKYENILMKFLNEYEKKEKNNESTFAQEKYIDAILLPFYYAMMINQDETLNHSLIRILENKINILKNIKLENINNNNLINIEKQISNKQINRCPIKNDKKNINSNLSNHLKTQKDNNTQKTQSNLIKMDFLDSNIQEKEKNEISSPSNSNNLNNQISNFEKMEKNFIEKKSENINQNSINKNLTEKEKSHVNIINKEKNEKMNIENQSQNNFIINNIIALKSGNFAIAEKILEIYNFRLLNYSDKKAKFDNNYIKEKSLLQKINLEKESKEHFINNVFQFVDETLLCSVFSKIIRVKLKDNDRNHEIIGRINLETMELPRKLISLGDSMLIILSNKGNNCYIKLYSKKDKNLNEYNRLNNELNSICETYGIIGNNTQKNNDINDKSKKIDETYVQKNNGNGKEINEDNNFKLVLDNINEKNKLWVSMFEIKKLNNINNEDKNKENYLYEFIVTSNAIYNSGEDKIIFYGLKKVFDKYIINNIIELIGLSCSIEPDTICQINKKYLLVSLQDYGKPNQKNGFALINIFKRECSKIIRDGPFSSLSFIEEKNYLFITKKIKAKNPYNLSIVYDIRNNDNKEKEGFIFKNIYEYKNKITDTITFIHPILLPFNNNNKFIFITSSRHSNFEIVCE